MQMYRALALYPVYADLGLQASARPGVLYSLRSQILIIPACVLSELRTVTKPEKLCDVDWAIHTAAFGGHIPPLSTTSLTIKAAEHVALNGCLFDVSASANRLSHSKSTTSLAQPLTHGAALSKPLSHEHFSRWLSRVMKVMKIVGKWAASVTGKTPTNIYR